MKPANPSPRNFLETQCKRIKTIVEGLSGIEDIGIRTTKRLESDLKKIYFKLCSEHTKSTYEQQAYILGNYDHSVVGYNLKQFENLTFKGQLKRLDVYYSASPIITKDPTFQTTLKPHITCPQSDYKNQISDLLKLLKEKEDKILFYKKKFERLKSIIDSI